MSAHERRMSPGRGGPVTNGLRLPHAAREVRGEEKRGVDRRTYAAAGLGAVIVAALLALSLKGVPSLPAGLTASRMVPTPVTLGTRPSAMSACRVRGTRTPGAKTS